MGGGSSSLKGVIHVHHLTVEEMDPWDHPRVEVAVQGESMCCFRTIPDWPLPQYPRIERKRGADPPQDPKFCARGGISNTPSQAGMKMSFMDSLLTRHSNFDFRRPLVRTGYLTVCFAMMVGPEGHAVGVEHIPELVAASIENISRSAAGQLMEGGSLSLHVADGRLGWPELAPYDAIHVGAAALEIPKALLDQLKPGGRMVIPVGNIFQDLKVVDKNLNGSITMQTDTSVRYVPLTSRAAQLQEI